MLQTRSILHKCIAQTVSNEAIVGYDWISKTDEHTVYTSNNERNMERECRR